MKHCREVVSRVGRAVDSVWAAATHLNAAGLKSNPTLKSSALPAAALLQPPPGGALNRRLAPVKSVLQINNCQIQTFHHLYLFLTIIKQF